MSEDPIRVMRLTLCKCGHEAIAHYDSYLFCTWTVEGKCDCEEFEAAELENIVEIRGEGEIGRA